MSFGGGFGGGGFGSSNNQGSTFGGFGQSTNNTTGFGSSNTGTGFGASNNTPGSSLFGGGNTNNNTTGSGFGGSGFGASANTTSPFGAKPASTFGASATTGGNMFGQSAATTGGGFGGGFGATANNTTPAFGQSAGSGGMFGAAKPAPAFGGATGGSIFGGNNTTASTGFGSPAAATTGFGGSGSGFGAAAASSTTPQNNGTATTPFQAHVEKDAASSSNSHYQSITFQPAYSAFSFEELRTADYNAGRRYGNSNGQAGAFGTSTGFGGFGQSAATPAPSTGFGASANTGGGLFGSSNTNSTGFGQSNAAPAAGGFGSSTGGGMFGAKPATGGGLFGAAPAASSTGTTGGGLFGTSGANNNSTGAGFGGGFGSTPANNTGGGLFGAANNQPAKPAFGGFGGAASTGGFGASASPAPAFGQGANNTTGGGLFGNAGNQQAAAPSGGLFGAQNNNQQQQQAPAGGSLFGGFGQSTNNNQQQQGQTGATGGGLFGGSGGFGQGAQQNNNTGGGLFGQNKPATGGGLFGNAGNQQQQQPATGGGLFGNTQQNNNTGGGLFGQNKPATTGGLFGGGASTTGQTGSGGGLFGGLGQNNQQQNNNSGGSLFGSSANNNQQKPGGLFGGLGGSTNNNGGGSLFGGSTNNSNNNNAGGSLFGGQNSQQGGLFGNSQNQQQPQQNNLGASLQSNPYGNDQLFTNLGSSTAPVGPIATPLSGAQKSAKRPAPLPQFKINPSASLRLITPQKRSTGYGLNYSTYGTPGSGTQGFQSNGLGSSLLQSGGLSRSLGKSFSTNSLRNTFGPEADNSSVLAPGAFTPNSRPYAGGSIRRLKIDRNLRTDLFGEGPASEPSTINRKRVSFTEDQGRVSTPLDTPENALVVAQTEEPEEIRPVTNGTQVNGTSRQEMERVRGNELAVVPEDVPAPTSTRSTTAKELAKSQEESAAPGEYWMSPSLQELRNMSREQLKNVHGYSVGRAGVGRVDFDDVDLTTVPLDEVLGNIVKLNVRNATVYETGVNTPPMGKGLNVPSTITLENSWPRMNGGRLPVHERKGPRFEKHLDRLRRVKNTEFISYDPESGFWVFRVPHFTTYGLDDDEDDEVEYPMDTQQPSPTPQAARHEDDSSNMSVEESNPDDTFDFKKGPSKNLPGNFDGDQPIYDQDMADETDAQDDSSFLEQRGMSMLEDPFRSSGSGNAAAFAVQAANRPVEEELAEEDEPVQQGFGASMMPKSILKQSTLFGLGTPRKDLALTGDWADQLQRTVSPKKQDRHALRERQSVMGTAPAAPSFAASVAGKAFNTTMDIMNSLWEPAASTTGNQLKKSMGGKGFEWPYPKRSKVDDAFADMSDTDRAFHTSVKPRWAVDDTLVYAIAGNAPQLDGNMTTAKRPIISEGRDVRFAKFTIKDTMTPALRLHMSEVRTTRHDIAPVGKVLETLNFSALAASVTGDSPEAKHERAVWRVTSILFDPIRDACKPFLKDLSDAQISELEHRIRRDALSEYWTGLVREDAATAVRHAANAEEKAIAFLTGNNIVEACTALVDGNDLRLATIIAQLPGNEKMREMVKKQIDAWRSQNVLSEISEPIRALYEIASGNVCVSEGKTGATEDRASTFNISTRFSLDWRRSFGLRLWYGSQSNESLADAVHSYTNDVASGKENVRPVPFFTEQGLPAAWEDTDRQTREDTLFGLLKLYSRKPEEAGLSIVDLLAPTSASGDPLNARMSWQLATLLRSKGIVNSSNVSNETVDTLSYSFASQLEAAGEYIYALSVLVHMTDDSIRRAHICSFLHRRAPALCEGSPTEVPPFLETVLNLPTAWIWRARALHAQSVLGDSFLQARYLFSAVDLEEALTVVSQKIGPQAVIAQDDQPISDTLAIMNAYFSQDTKFPGWEIGGLIYVNYLMLRRLEGENGERDMKLKKDILRTLVKDMPNMVAVKNKEKVLLEERVAVDEMSKYVRAEVERMTREEKKTITSEPLHPLEALAAAGDAYALKSVQLSDVFFQGLHGKGRVAGTA